MNERRRVVIPGLHQDKATLTKFYLPETALETLNNAAGPRGRSHWIYKALEQFAEIDELERNELLLHDAAVRRSSMTPVSVRVSGQGFMLIRSLTTDFHRTFPAYDVDASSVLRGAVLWRLRELVGPLALP